VLQQKLWYLFPYIGRVHATGKVRLHGQLTNGVQRAVVYCHGDVDKIKNVQSQLLFLKPKEVYLEQTCAPESLMDQGVLALSNEDVVFSSTELIAVESYNIGLLHAPGVVEKCFPNLKIIQITFNYSTPSDVEIQETLNKLKDYGKTVKLIIRDTDGNEIVRVYTPNEQGGLVLKETRDATGWELLN
jgi:hypothetical protein